MDGIANRTMLGWTVAEPGQLSRERLPVPEPGPGEVLVRVLACGVCRTDLHVRDGDLPAHRSPVVPGHEVVGEVVGTGPGESEHPVGSRVGIPWLRRTCGECRFCQAGRENLCPRSEYTGWDADGGYAEFATAPAAYVYRLPADRDPVEQAPLLCAGIIGYRALRRANVPAGGRLGIYGFGASAHLTAQLAIAEGTEVHVFTRAKAARRLALQLGALSARETDADTPVPLDGVVLFAPVGDLVPVAMAALDRGGTLAIAGIHLSDVPTLRYADTVFYERDLRSVTANTRTDGREFLELAAVHRIRPAVSRYRFEEADRALDDLASDRVDGVAVLDPNPS